MMYIYSSIPPNFPDSGVSHNKIYNLLCLILMFYMPGYLMLLPLM